MRYQRFCQRPHRCIGDGGRADLQGQFPEDDVAYVLTHFCIYCRLDGEVRWFMDAFSINNGLLL